MQEYDGLKRIAPEVPMNVLADPRILPILSATPVITMIQGLVARFDLPVEQVLIRPIFFVGSRVEMVEIYYVTEKSALIVRQTLCVGANGRLLIPDPGAN